MIPREILKKIRQLEIRTNRIVTETLAGARVHLRIPTGFRPKAQGCEERATLGQRPTNTFNRNAVAAMPFPSATREDYLNPVGVDDHFIPFTQGSSCVATLGWRTQSLWDWFIRLRAELRAGFVVRANLLLVPDIRQPSKIITTPTGLWQPI